MKISTYSLQGRRPSNEDQHINVININNVNKNYHPINYIGIFDGHGGKLVSKFLKENLPKYILKKSFKNLYQQKNIVVSKFFGKLYDKIEDKLEKTHPIASKRCGSTALSGIHYLDKNKNPMIWILNVGDCRAVLCNYKYQSISLTKDHKPNSINEKKRIEQLGGKIKFDGSDWRIKDLSLSRAFGDVDTKPYITHKPEIFRVKLNKKDKFIIFILNF